MAGVGPIGGGIGIAPPTEQIREEGASPEALRKMSEGGDHPGIRQRVWGLAARVDPTVTFEEYRFWAKIERRWEAEEIKEWNKHHKGISFMKPLKQMFVKGPYDDRLAKEEQERGMEKEMQAITTAAGDAKESDSDDAIVKPAPPPVWSEEDRNAEWRQAARALRTATWGGIFYLVTTDILGWGATPFVFASVGYGIGVALFVIFGVAAGVSAWAIWRVFLGLDSSRYPMLSYGDPFFRTYGAYTRHFVNITQAIQMFCQVMVLLLGQAQTLAQLSNDTICYVATIIIIMVVGMVSGALRSLKHLSWLSSAAVYLNIISFAIICGSAAHYLPAYDSVTKSTFVKKVGPVKTFAGPPPVAYQQQSKNEFSAQFNGIDNMVYSYAGALFFVAFLAEMRHPMDFWKGVFLAQAFICFIYIFFGAFVYSFWGQYCSSVINTTVNPLSLQIVGNVLALLTGFIAIFLYFNVGMKTVYLEVGQEIFGLPPITTKKGKYLWWGLGPFYWILAFVVAASVPNFNGIANLVGGLLAVNFTYTLPGFMYVAYKIQCGAVLPGEGFDPVTGQTTRHDGGVKRWWRGFVKTWPISLPMVLFAGGGLACSGMGSWAAIEGLIQIFGQGGTVTTSWGCASPV